MAAAFLGAVEDAPDGPARAAIARMAGGRRFFLAEFDVPAGRQAGADKLGYCALAVFRIMADDRATLRAMRAADFLPDSPTDGLAAVSAGAGETPADSVDCGVEGRGYARDGRG